MTAPRPTRRDVLRAGAATAAATAVVASGATGAAAAPPAGTLELHINDGFVPMVDGSLVYMRGFGDVRTPRTSPRPSLTVAPRAFLADGRLVDGRVYPLGARKPPHGRPSPAGPDTAAGPGVYKVRPRTWASIYPRRTIIAETGATVRLRVHNHLAAPHRFHVQDLGVDVAVPPAQWRDISFRVDDAGTYVYSDPTNLPVERVLGLHGVLLVVPTGDRWRAAPGSVTFERQWLWICHDVDPVWGQLAAEGRAIDPRTRPSVPRYFTLNDRSGYRALALTPDAAANDAAHEDSLPSGWPRRTDARRPEDAERTGQVVRMVNTGVAVHQMHFHGNHIWTFRRDNVELSRSHPTFTEDGHVRLQQWEDVVELDPLQRVDCLLPLRPPPDVVPAVWAARKEDWIYPMHCHAEMSQSAGGGVYPGGLVSEWVLAGGPPPTGGA